MQQHRVTVKLPSFKLEQTTNLKEILPEVVKDIDGY